MCSREIWGFEEMTCLRMLFAVGPECRRALQVRPFRGYDADDSVARIGATRNEPKLKQDPEGARRGLRRERMRAGSGERRPQLRTGHLAAGAEGAEGAPDDFSRGRLAGEDGEGELALGLGEQSGCRNPGRSLGGGDALDVRRGARGIDEDDVLEVGGQARGHREGRVVGEGEAAVGAGRQLATASAPQRWQAISAAPPLKRARPVAPLASAARRDASAATARTPAPLDTSSAIEAVGDEPALWTTCRGTPSALPWSEGGL